MTEIDDEVLQDLYAWIDQIPLSRPKRNIARDFSDAVLMAEIVNHYFPKLVELHNFSACSATDQKKRNWLLLNWKTFKKLGFELSADVIDSIANAKPGTIERVLLLLRTKLDRSLFQQQRASDSTEAADHQQLAASAAASGSPGRVKPGQKHQQQLQQQQQQSPRLSYGKPSSLPMKQSDSLQRVGQSDFVTRLAFEQKVQECLAKSETIEILQAKVRRLEHLLHLKDVRIDDLQVRLDELRPTGSQHQQQHLQDTAASKRVAIPRAM